MRPRPNSAPGRADARLDWARALFLVVATVVAYEQVRRAGFIWDDDAHLTQNPCIIGPLGLKDIWTTRAARHFPLILTTFWIEHAIWGLNPLLFHLVNVLMHAASAVVLWRVLETLGVKGAFLGAALWALHPVQVETVAWVTELKNTQSCLFYLLSVLCFARWVKADRAAERSWDYAAALAFAALAMASKSSTVVLPAVLGLCAWWLRGSLRLRDAVRLIPVLVMSAADIVLVLWTQHLEGANDAEWARGLPERLATVGPTFWFYLGKLAWPHPLIFIYPRWTIEWTHPAAYLPLSAMVAFFLALWGRRKGRLRPAFFAFTYFLIALSPVLGLLDQFFWRYSFVGDHFQYLASMGPLALAGAGITVALNHLGEPRRILAPVTFAAVVCLLGAMTWKQSEVFRDDETLWQSTLALNPECWMAHNNLGTDYLQSGRLQDSVEEFEKGLEIRSNDFKAHQNLGNALLRLGRLDEAAAQFQAALGIDPNFDMAHGGLGEVFLRQGRPADAIEQFQLALKINPDLEQAEVDYGKALAGIGRTNEALEHFRRALSIDPRDTHGMSNLGSVLLDLGQKDAAVAEYDRALAIDPLYTTALVNKASAELQLGAWHSAEMLCRKALEIAPDLAEAHNNLAAALIEEGHLDEAISHCRRALEIKPGFRDAKMNLGKALYKKGHTEEAEALFREATGAK
ncbi:MAG TPA: tetratricopeptide repeat protein [Opitutaceae bacterium]